MKRSVVILCGIALIGGMATSCVSKKKFDALTYEKWNADNKIAELNAQIEQNAEEFNAIRYELAQNNAEKEKSIQELNNRLKDALQIAEELKQNLENTTDKMNLSSMSSDEQIKELSAKLTLANAERKELQQMVNNLEFTNRELKGSIERVEREVAERDNQIKIKENEKSALAKKVSQLQQEIKRIDEEREKLQNQVNLLRKELGL
ncbi:MAG: hypothetical protein J6K74_02400 [Marinifilaceae bacterium]|nr:hypothetical protein [Marinifilaceae bacterium]